MSTNTYRACLPARVAGSVVGEKAGGAVDEDEGEGHEDDDPTRAAPGALLEQLLLDKCIRTLLSQEGGLVVSGRGEGDLELRDEGLREEVKPEGRI